MEFLENVNNSVEKKTSKKFTEYNREQMQHNEYTSLAETVKNTQIHFFSIA